MQASIPASHVARQDCQVTAGSPLHCWKWRRQDPEDTCAMTGHDGEIIRRHYTKACVIRFYLYPAILISIFRGFGDHGKNDVLLLASLTHASVLLKPSKACMPSQFCTRSEHRLSICSHSNACDNHFPDIDKPTAGRNLTFEGKNILV
jgi:hypothetical protein